jgi:hypothetical protein
MGNATLLALVFSLTFASSGGAADRSFAPDENGQIVFVTPSGNIGCTYIPKGGTAMYTPDDGGPELGCDRIQPLYVRLGKALHLQDGRRQRLLQRRQRSAVRRPLAGRPVQLHLRAKRPCMHA